MELRGQTESAFQSYTNSCPLAGNGSNPIPSRVGTPLQLTAHGPRRRGAREGRVINGIAIAVEGMSGKLIVVSSSKSTPLSRCK
jgi:hypothetical protein